MGTIRAVLYYGGDFSSWRPGGVSNEHRASQLDSGKDPSEDEQEKVLHPHQRNLVQNKPI